MTFDTTHTWPDGSPKSMHTAFAWRKDPEPPTADELRLEKQRIYKRNRSAKKSALRVNQERHLGSGLTNSEKAPR